jgi:hypothetical protein
MSLRIVATAPELTEAIDSFDAAYHAGFAAVKQLAEAALAEEPAEPLKIGALAERLRQTLYEYGAAEPGKPTPGAPGAPVLRGHADFIDTLSQQELQEDLLTLTRWSRYAAESNLRGEFDDALFRSLRTLGQGLFENNTNVTYPMKAVLLTTGFMPAFDSQVRNGLHKAGLKGFSGTRFLLPDNRDVAAWRRLSGLPVLLNTCWNRFEKALQEAIQASEYPELLISPGRVFDVLLFVQGRKRKPIRSIEYQGSPA